MKITLQDLLDKDYEREEILQFYLSKFHEVGWENVEKISVFSESGYDFLTELCENFKIPKITIIYNGANILMRTIYGVGGRVMLRQVGNTWHESTYDKNGNIIYYCDNKNYWVRYTFTNFNKMETYEDSNGDRGLYIYNSNKKLIKFESTEQGVWNIKINYDHDGNLISYVREKDSSNDFLIDKNTKKIYFKSSRENWVLPMSEDYDKKYINHKIKYRGVWDK